MLKFKLPKVTSTQDFAEAIYSFLYEDYLVYAEEQTKARGRYKREWYSPKGGLWFTYAKRNFNLEKIGIATIKVSLAVREVISKYVNALIRWPNDVVVKDKKISGVLLEGIASDINYLFIGVGINTNVKEFPKDLVATSIYLETGKEVDNERLLDEVVAEIEKYLNLDDETTIKLLNQYLSIKDKQVKITTLNNEVKQCEALFVDNYGRLITDCGIFEVEDVLRLET